VTTLTGSYVSHLLQTRSERRHRLRDVCFQLYLTLRPCEHYHFWVCAIHHPRLTYAAIKEGTASAESELLEKLRNCDESPFVERIVHTIISEDFEREEGPPLSHVQNQRRHGKAAVTALCASNESRL
jgi:hypothetical protein